jgi:hypothetical protein
MVILLVSFACRDNLIGPDNGDLHLRAEAIGVVDLYLHVRVTQGNEQRTLSVDRDGVTVFSAHILGLDTVIICDSLLPIHSYKFSAQIQGKDIFSTFHAELNIITLDTTSHNFTWVVDTLGDGNNSNLRDVTILNDTCVVAVGEIHIRDSSGNWDPRLYSVAKWNGKEWTLHEISFPVYGYGCTLAGYDPGTAQAAFSFGEKSILITDGVQIVRWDGDTTMSYPCVDPFQMLSGQITKIWGTSENNIYAVGRNGTIIHYSNGVWQKMESGTDVDLLDVYGSPDGSEVWACGWIDFKPTVLLRLRNGIWEKAWEEDNPFTQRDDTLSGAFTSVWLPNNRQVFAFSWYGVYNLQVTTRGEGNRIQLPSTWSGFPWRLRGVSVNDLVIVGEYYMLAHFNGLTFKHYTELSGYGRLVSVAQQNNFVVAVGYLFDSIHSRGIVFRGRR